MSYLKKLVSLTHQMVPPLYRTRAITSTRLSTFPRNKVSALLMRKYCNKAHPGPSRQLYHSHGRSFPPSTCAFGLISGTIFRQWRKFHSTVNLERSYQTGITAAEPNFPIFSELRLYVNHNPTGHLSVEVYVHGLWMCYYDSNGHLIHLINEMPTEADGHRAEQELAELDDSSLFDLISKWPNFYGADEKFWVEEFVKHSLTSIGEYRPHYFRDVLSICGPFIGGQKDIAKFLHNNYVTGVHYSAQKIQGELSEHLGADVQIVGSNTRPFHLQEIGILFTRDGKVLVNHPKGSFASVPIIVRLY